MAMTDECAERLLMMETAPECLGEGQEGVAVGELFFELELIPCAAGNDVSLQPDENLPALPSFQPIPEPTREPAHIGSFLCTGGNGPFFNMSPAPRPWKITFVWIDNKPPIKLNKNSDIVERKLCGTAFVARPQGAWEGAKLCFCTVRGREVSQL